MLEILSKGFRSAKEALTGHTTLTEENIDSALRDVRVSLLEADVELGVVRSFLGQVKTRALGEVVQTRGGGQAGPVGPAEHFVRICHRELEALMGPVQEAPIVFRRPLTMMMMVGLQGTGKTTTCGKLARYLLAQKRRPLLVAADLARPAAVEQLRVLGERLEVPVYSDPALSPAALAAQARAQAKKLRCDVVIVDTAGRLAIDAPLMRELADIERVCAPDNTFLVCDAMAGQDTVRTAGAFNDRLRLTGFIMTKLDGDARGGAALSIKAITGKPIKFLGLGEDLAKLEVFRPEGLASRILGMGDIVGLMRDFEQVVDSKQAARDTKKLLRGQFTLDDFLSQLRTLKKVGSVKDIAAKLPIPGLGGSDGPQLEDGAFVAIESLIQSMTPRERQQPQIIEASRARRIARGAGRKPDDVTELVGRFQMMQQMMGCLMGQPGLLSKIPGLGRHMGRGRGAGTGAGMRGMPDMGKLAQLAGRAGSPFGGGAPPGMGGGVLPGMGLSPGTEGGVGWPGGAMSGGGIPPGMMPGPAAAPSVPSARTRQRLKQKRKNAKAARKRSRR